MMAFPDPLDNLLLPSLSPNDNFSPASSSISSNASTVWSPSHSHYSSLSSMLTANTSENTTAESSDRETILFPTYAMRCPQTHEWIIHIRGWALSHNISAVKQKVATGLTKNLIAEGSPNHGDHLFEQRFKYFLAKNKRNKHFVIHASGATSLEHRPLDPRDNIPDVYSSRRSSSGSDDSGFQSATEDYYKVTSTEDFAFDEFSPVYDPILESRPGNPLSTILDGGNKFYVTDSPSTATLSSYEEYHDDLFDESQLIEECNQLTIQSECTSTTEDSSESLHSASTPHSIVLKSESNGFYNGQIRVSDSQIQEWMSGQASTNRLVQLQSKASGFAPGLTHVSLVEEHGISIISDIDDTIKDTQILSGARTVLTNTFCKEAQAVEGMAKAYKDWYDSGASFHYVSNSPFQLLPMLDQFIKDKQFPPGSMHLRVDGSILARLVEVPGRAKRDAIKQIMNDFPKRQFVLIGDSGEIDLEIYARIASEFPGRVLKIFIRDVSKKPSASVRRRNTLSSLFASPKRSKSVTTSQPPPPPPPLSENGRAQTLADLATSSSGIHSRVAKAREQCPVDIELFQNAETLQRDPVIWHALCQ